MIVKRRYSEFKSLRDSLQILFPTLVIPPIPEKHTLFTYLINSIDNSKELNIIETRKRCFANFLKDIIFDSNAALKSCVLVHKFLDPNYELCWNNAINEPPVSLIPNNLLLANPVNPTDQNGLYSLLPIVNGFELNSNIDNISSLHKLNEDLHKLNEQVHVFELRKEQNDKRRTVEPATNLFTEIPISLIDFEKNFHQNIKVLTELNKLNSRSVKNFKSIIHTLVELGGNLNNFSLQIHELNTESNELSSLIEKFGSTIDSNFLGYEAFLMNDIIPEWQEPISQLVQYYLTSLQLIKFYKFKIIQYKLVYKLKFNKYQELANISNNFESQLKLQDLRNLDIDSPSINEAIKKIELNQKRLKNRKLSSKKSWYGLFGGNSKPTFTLNEDMSGRLMTEGNGNIQARTSLINEENMSYPVNSSANLEHTHADINSHYQHKISQIEKELTKLDQLIDLTNTDMSTLTLELNLNFNDFLVRVEKKWLVIMLEFIKNGKQLFKDNLQNWNECKVFINDL
ncbi:uncharacterized protein AC631_05646 [Debaryomyces fabryi]|uniref:PX domain-containing protein n=1 Tax=Debaryomyces fabryi TaxID=58627 RepID=A0A0V1PRE1_9ASCO|nr:uncharacterized protein AC631_05646 [Debaryomyces fabryi]KRZ98590.1 hypothetical protein AC631_05646 [Debaryomyces fabryi]